MNEYIQRQTQRRIFNIIVKNPGIHLTRIAELLNIPVYEVEQQLKFLEKNQTITASTKEGYKKYYSKKEITTEIDEQIIETRQRIYELILKNPGLHQAKIAQMLTMRKSLAEYHLQYLEKTKAIISIKKEGYRRYFVEDGDVAEEDKKILSLVRQKIPFKIVTLLLEKSILKHKEILSNFDIAPSTLTYHLNKLIKQGVIEVTKYGDEKGYSIKNRKKLMKFVIRYDVGIAAESFKDLWDDIH